MTIATSATRSRDHSQATRNGFSGAPRTKVPSPTFRSSSLVSVAGIFGSLVNPVALSSSEPSVKNNNGQVSLVTPGVADVTPVATFDNETVIEGVY